MSAETKGIFEIPVWLETRDTIYHQCCNLECPFLMFDDDGCRPYCFQDWELRNSNDDGSCFTKPKGEKYQISLIPDVTRCPGSATKKVFLDWEVRK